MENLKEQIKRLRKEVLKTFLLIFVPHIFVSLLTTQIAVNQSSFMDWHISWFFIYFSIAFLLYILAPKIIQVSNKKKQQ